MLTLDDLGLTPKQFAETELADPQLVSAWLEAAGLNTGLKSPAGWFLAGLRSGQPPADLDDARRRRAVSNAEALVRNVGHAVPDVEELVASLFGPGERTADLATLERLELGTRENPGRSMYEGTLHAAIAATRTHGTREIPGSRGPLAGLWSAELEHRMVSEWRRVCTPLEAVASADIDWAA